MTVLEWIRVWVDFHSVTTVTELDFTETAVIRDIAVIDKDIVRFDVCSR